MESILNERKKSRYQLCCKNRYPNTAILLNIFILLYLLPWTCYCINFIRQYPTFPFHAARPRFIVQPENQEADAGSHVKLKCSGEANPQPLLFWYKEGHRQLMFSQSSNEVPKSSTARWPQTAPLVSSDPRSSMPTSDTSPSINKLFTMSISPEHNPTSSFSDNYFGNRIYVDNQGTLNIMNATSSDSGYYACALISSVGSVLGTAKLTIKQQNSPTFMDQYEPSYMNDPSQFRTNSASASKFDLLPPPVIKLGAANQTLPTNTSATLNCEVVSQVLYRIQWLFEGQVLQEEPNRVMVSENGALVIDNLKPSDSGIYTCVVTAANDQAIPLANPFETLDSSMLTSAPPIPQTTSHSTMLKVASPMNPNIQFHRMDAYAYPSSPGPANLVSTNGNDGITIAWAAPADSGTLPIREYIIEHFDTSQDLGWREIYTIKAKESLFIDGLSSEGSHFFVIRAANSRGVGPSSAIAGPFRTVSGEARYQQELQRRRDPLRRPVSDFTSTGSLRPEAGYARDRLMTISTNLVALSPISSSSIRLQWSIQLSNNVSSNSYDLTMGFSLPSLPDVNEFLGGYSIRYRAIGTAESLLSQDVPTNINTNVWSSRSSDMPASLPLITSFIDDQEDSAGRQKRDLANYFDYSQEFKEVKVADHNAEQYTVNDLRPFTLYQFFVVPYYKDIDGVPSNILTAQTNEDKPSVAPPNLTVHPINNTAVRLLWLHIPPAYTNGILRGYVVQINRSDMANGQQVDATGVATFAQASRLTPSRILNLPLGSVNVVPIGPYNSEMRSYPYLNNIQQYIVMYDLTNLTFKSFYSLQVAGFTSSGHGPWSDTQNFIMDPATLSQLRANGNEIDDVISKTLISNGPHTYVRGGPISSTVTVRSLTAIMILIVIIIVFFYYTRDRNGVVTWKKTITEHFNNKFYMPSTVDSRGLNSIQQNIYDHQQHLIYSGSSQINRQAVGSQSLWANNGCMTSSGTGSISSHGGPIGISADPNRRIVGDQMLVMNGKDMSTRFIKCQTDQRANQMITDSTRINPNDHIGHQGDYYSVINNMAEYEELDNHQRNNIQIMTNADHVQTASSNSDTSCPNSVTRLLPNQNYTRELLSKKFSVHPRHDSIPQQQRAVGNPMMFANIGLSPYATTNLANQDSVHQQIIPGHQVTLIDTSRQPNIIMHNGNATMDDSSRAFLSHQQQQSNGAQHYPCNVFRTLQRNPVNQQARNNHQFVPMQSQQFMQPDNSNTRMQNQPCLTGQYQANSATINVSSNPLSDMKSNLYEHVDYTDNMVVNQNQSYPSKNRFQNSQTSNDVISSSTSSGSMKSSPQQGSPEQQTNSTRFRRGSQQQANNDSEAHDLRVFSSSHDTRPLDEATERDVLNGGYSIERYEGGESRDVNRVGATALRQEITQDDGRARQLSKRKRLQQRNRLHNNQGID